MKKFLALAAVATLAACGEKAADDAATTDIAATEEVAAAAVTAPAPGSYTATYADGTVVPYTTNEVGVYTATVDGAEIKGTYTSEGARSCFDPAGDGEDEGEVCWTATAADETGSFTATSDAGETVTVAPAG
ncbi:hypothetical protein GCM10023115_16470 [Pontixanthobacter gangjinensis]|uniref:Uncharacterized protein n=1 Tax=Pontixanthobacter gangjinensis TaxID=1028742 RepID=A0A6I4SLX3_9SPHN|nr:hypothetical protein [Pontixanthobacter gangjinensis]MXO56891.1 hypothetical protein [Pontixanthobacter gangjinensis]